MKPIEDDIRAILAAPQAVMTEAEIRLAERATRTEARRERLTSSPIVDHLGHHDGVSDVSRILRDTVQPTLAMRAVMRWTSMWTNPVTAPVARPWLILAGPTGAGKTMAAAWAVAEVGARYVRFPELVQDHRAFGRRSSMAEQESARVEWRRKYGGNLFVILDELGIEGEADREEARAAFHEFVEVRQRWTQRTLVLTNKNNQELLARFASGQYDPRTRSRLQRLLVTATDDPNLLALDLGGEDLRAKR